MTLKELNRSDVGRWFFSKVKKTSKCWLWTSAKMSDYGWLHDPISKKNKRAHQWIMLQLYGLPKKGYEVCHKCNVRACVNPKHLYYGTRKDNIRDQINAGVHNFLNHKRIGVNSPSALLDEKTVRGIRSMRADGFKYKEIAEKFKLNINTVGNVINNHRYKSVV